MTKEDKIRVAAADEAVRAAREAYAYALECQSEVYRQVQLASTEA